MSCCYSPRCYYSLCCSPCYRSYSRTYRCSPCISRSLSCSRRSYSSCCTSRSCCTRYSCPSSCSYSSCCYYPCRRYSCCYSYPSRCCYSSCCY